MMDNMKLFQFHIGYLLLHNKFLQCELLKTTNISFLLCFLSKGRGVGNDLAGWSGSRYLMRL